MNRIDLDIPGEPTSIRTLAAWFTQTLSAGLRAASDALRGTRSSSAQGFEGEAGDAFRTKLGDALSALWPVEDYVNLAGKTLNDYAELLELGHTRSTHLAEDAHTADLVVTGGRYIQAPVSPLPVDCFATPPPPPPQEKVVAAKTYWKQAAEYARISTAMRQWWSEHDQWVQDNIPPLLDGEERLSVLAQVWDTLRAANVDLFASAGFEAGTQTRNTALDGLRASLKRVAEEAVTANPQGLARFIEADRIDSVTAGLNAQIEEGVKIGRYLRFGGATITVVTSTLDLATGTPADVVGVGLLGGAAGAAVAGAGVEVLGLGPLAGVPVVVVSSAVLANYLQDEYQKVVPETTRETIDHELPYAYWNSSTVAGSGIALPRIVFPRS
ncbi:hypothetical protein D9V34_02220 [Mycetocola lacteus]|uniref:Uncharacterized protein n=1 Tax=Mycetocola lacteus TaxID=76637 RepID=A0A3L7AUG2_9MICO|nr:hypothetical protein [Mycetocola lacteus]RLP83655.1 hypothetical protein D9V34_02220 [Mycetocola lacteus]